MPTFPRLRLKRLATRLRPRSALARFTAYIGALSGGFWAVEKLSSAMGHPRFGGSFSFWTTALMFTTVVLGLSLLARWTREKLMWRLRNRLIVTYVFIGVIPVLLLVVLASITAFLFAGQFATFLAVNEMQSELKRLEAANTVIAMELASHIEEGDRGWRKLLERHAIVKEHFPGRQLTVWVGEQEHTPADATSGAGRTTAVTPAKSPAMRPKWLAGNFRDMVLDQGKVYLRVSTSVAVRGEKQRLTVLSSIPMEEKLPDIATRLGRVNLYVTPEEDRETGEAMGKSARQARGTQAAASAGVMAPARNLLDREIAFAAPFSIVRWKDGGASAALLGGSTRVSRLYPQLFVTLGDWASYILSALLAIGLVFALIELLALVVGVRITRTITRSVAALYRSTQHINRGDFRHRIPVSSNDQLAELERSFNSMTESLERLIAEQKEKERLQSELAIAQEVQAMLFPQSPPVLESLELHGVCLPARTVSGDYYDFIALGPDRVAIAVGDISGKGISAALLMATVHSAVRAYEFGRVALQEEHLQAIAGSRAVAASSAVRGATLERVPGVKHSPAEVLWQLNQHLYRSTPEEKYATMFLSVYEGSGRELTYSNAGHLPPMVMSEDGSVRHLDHGGTVVGLFEGTTYEERTVKLREHDIFVAFSDGIIEPENEFGEFGEERLAEIVRRNRHLALERISEQVMLAVQDWIGSNEQPDDVTLVLARAR